MGEEIEEKCAYVLLDFQGKDTSRFLKQNSIYFRMLNLNETKPIIEIEEDIYEGVYEDAVGTNIFFEEIENPPRKTNIFEGTSPIALKFFLKQSKILKLKKIGTKSKPVIDSTPTESVNICIQDDYRVLLEKFENDFLNIEDYIVNEPEETSEEEESEEDESLEPKEYKWEMIRLPPRQDLLPEWYVSGKLGGKTDFQTNPIYAKYIKLQKLAEQPARHETVQEIFQDNAFTRSVDSLLINEFVNWKKLVMNVVEQQPINLDINPNEMEDFVDVEKSIETGIIPSSNEIPRIYTQAEKQNLLSFENFINVSPLMKLMMLNDFIQMEKTEMEQMMSEELERKGEDGCTPVERLKLLKEFKEELKNHIELRIQDAVSNDETLQALEEININLSDCDDFSDTDLSSSFDEGEDNLAE